MHILRLIIILFLSFNVYAGDEDKAKKGVIKKITAGGSNFIRNVIKGDGDTEVQITTGEDYKPEFSIMSL